MATNMASHLLFIAPCETVRKEVTRPTSHWRHTFKAAILYC